MRAFDGIDDLASAVGEDIGTSSWITVDQRRIDMFAEATEDHMWLHVDPERAAAGPFGGTIAHGFLTLSLVAPVLSEVVDVRGPSAAMNYGLDRVRFLRPVPCDSRIRGQVTLTAVEAAGTGVRATWRVSIDVDDADDKPACIADMVSVYLP